MQRRLTCFGVSLLCLTLFSCVALAEGGDWPTFRGSDRTGVAPDTDLLKKWPAEGPELLWTATGMGRGYSSPAIANGAIYTLGDGLSTVDDEDEYLICINEADGTERWRSKTGPAWKKWQPAWQSSRSTPTVDGEHVYALTAQGVLICFNTEGSEVWRRDLKEDLAGQKADIWGYSESVLIDGDHLICTPGGPDNTMVALDKETGDLIWSCSRPGDRGAGHASIVISNVAGTKVYVNTTGTGAIGVRADDGKLLWSYEIKKTTAVIPTPIVVDDLVFFTAGYGTGGALVRQIPSEDGVEIDEIYPTMPTLQNKHGGVVLVGNYIYGDAGDGGVPFCANMYSGEVQWKSRSKSGKKSASIAAADGHLYIRYTNGAMTLVKASPDGFEEVSSFMVPGSGDRPSWAHPVVTDGKLYLREGDMLHCYSLRS